MKKLLLSFSFLFLSGLMYGQCGDGNCNDDRNYGNVESVRSVKKPKVEFKVYPNPTVDFIRVDDLTAEKGNVRTLHLFNMAGQMEKSFTIEKEASYNVSSLNPGTYLVQFRNFKGEVVWTRKLIKSDRNILN